MGSRIEVFQVKDMDLASHIGVFKVDGLAFGRWVELFAFPPPAPKGGHPAFGLRRAAGGKAPFWGRGRGGMGSWIEVFKVIDMHSGSHIGIFEVDGLGFGGWVELFAFPPPAPEGGHPAFGLRRAAGGKDPFWGRGRGGKGSWIQVIDMHLGSHIGVFKVEGLGFGGWVEVILVG